MTSHRGGRLALVISSQCANMPELDFLPPKSWQPGDPIADGRQLPLRVYEQLTDPAAGRSSPVPRLGDVADAALAAPGLLVNPTVATATAALGRALEEANAAEAALVLHYVGHGYAHTRPNGEVRHFLQVADTAEIPSNTQPPSLGWDPYGYVEEVRDEFPLITGLVMLVDACFASTAVPTIRTWIDPNVALPFLWIGSSQVTQAYDGCFSAGVAAILDGGITRDHHPRGNLVSDLGAADVIPLLTEACQGQKPADVSSQASDPALFVAGNRAAERRRVDLGLDAITGRTMTRLLENYQPAGLTDLLRLVRSQRLTAVVGEAGSGKSTLVAAWRDPPPEAEFLSVDGVVFVTATTTSSELSERLSEQLQTALQFRQAVTAFKRNNEARWSSLSRADQILLGPLDIYGRPATVVFDGLDQLSSVTEQEVLGLIADLAAHPNVDVVVTSRPDGPIPDGAEVIPMPELSPDAALTYLAGLGIEAAKRGALVSLAEGNWLVLDLAARQHRNEPDAAPDTRSALYANIFDRAADRHGTHEVQAVLTVLSAAPGPGPLIPFAIFANAVARLGGPELRTDLYRILGDPDLYSVLLRVNPTAPDEHVGAFHATLIEELGRRAGIELRRGHEAIVRAIEDLSPIRPPADDADGN